MEYIEYLNSPVGLLEIKASETGISHVNFVEQQNQVSKGNNITGSCVKQLCEYFENTRKIFDIPFDTTGTSFQKSVWSALTTIPFGQSASYQDIANAIDNPKAVRAVGLANGKNPISIIVPCHRVIGKNKSLTGYAGGLDRKSWLLSHEKIVYKE